MVWKKISISTIELNNFKKFYGFHKIDLLTKPSKPLILIGGDNGRGKTSIHEAIYYTLYEDDDLPGIQTRPNYIKAVSDRLNRRALDEGKTDYSVAIELILFPKGIGTERRIRIERKWEVNVGERKVIAPSLSIYENERPIDWIDDNAYLDFLRTILPPRIAPFFLFDGERIQDFAEDDTQARLVESIEDILHINVYRSLREDLKSFVIDHIEKNEIEKYQHDDLYQLQGEKERIQASLEKCKEELEDISRKEDDLEKEQKRNEDELRRIASPHASQRDLLIEEREGLHRDLEEIKNQIQAGFEPLPILLTGVKLRQALRKQLEDEQRKAPSQERMEELRNQMEEIKSYTFFPTPNPPNNVQLNENQLDYYIRRFDEKIKELFFIEVDTLRMIHDIGDAARRLILEKLTTIESKGTSLRETIDNRERISSDIREVELKIQSTSDDPYIAQLIKRNREINEEIGALKEKKNSLQGEKQRFDADLAIRSRQIEDRLEQKEKTSNAKKSIDLAKEARRVLDDFIKELAPEKLSLLKKYMDEMYSRLKKREDPIHSIEINRDTWQVILRDKKGRALEKRVFSQGMKEIYALSLLWALAKASGRELPIIIDTPVGRLDSTNRRSLFEKYLPYAGHQVIVLCTDTEIDIEWAKRLSPHVAFQYRLDYDQELDTVVIRPGYFF